MGNSVVAERPAAGGRPPSERARRQRDDQRLMRRHQRGDTTARDELIERYMPLARSLALRYRRASEPLDDLVQVASVGLVKAVDRWDPERGLAFSSYAVPTILGELRRYFRDATWDVRPARDLQELCLSVEEAREALWGELGRSPTVADIAGRLDRSPEDVVEALQATEGRSVRSLDAPVHEEEGASASAGDLLGSDDPEFDRVEAGVTLPLVSHRHAIELAVEIARPEVKEVFEPREAGMDVVLLPDIALQERRMFRHAIENLCRCQAEAGQLCAEVAIRNGGHGQSPHPTDTQHPQKT